MTPDEFAKNLADTPAKNRTLLIKADKSAPYDFVMQIMNTGLQAGFSVVLATGEPQK